MNFDFIKFSQRSLKCEYFTSERKQKMIKKNSSVNFDVFTSHCCRLVEKW